LTEVEDLPSPGRAEVTTMTRTGLSTSANCRLVRSRRYASARCDTARLPHTSGEVLAVWSCGTAASTGVLVMSRRSSIDRTAVSSRSRSAAPNNPSTSPTMKPSGRYSFGFGDTGVALTRGPLTVSSDTVAELERLSSSCCTSLGKVSASPCAIVSARTLSSSLIVAVSRTVLSVTDPVMRPATSAALRFRPAWSTIACPSRWELTSSA
jgi:hypothetical protein